MNIVLTMILSGSMLFCLYVILNSFNDIILLPHHKYIILKMSLLFSLIPFAYLKPVINWMLKLIFPARDASDMAIKGQAQALMVTPDGKYANFAYNFNSMIVVVWFGVATLVFLVCVKRYVSSLNKILQVTQECNSDDVFCIVQKYKKVLNIKKDIRVFISQVNVSPFTIGIIHPIIVLPEVSDTFAQEFIIYHELCHIKNNDGLIKFLQLLVVGIYWFNPLVYFLNMCLDNVCEQSCDEDVTRYMNYEQCRQYAYLIVNMASMDGMWSSPHIIPLSDNKENIKERITLIMSKKCKRTKASLLLSLGMVMCSSFSVLAYQEPIKVEWEIQPEEDVFLENVNQAVSFRMKNDGYKFLNNTNSIIYEEQFIDQFGNIYPIENERGERAKCNEHVYIDGIYEKHTKNKDGSCLTKAYNCQRCQKCGIFKLGSLVNETKYTKCPH